MTEPAEVAEGGEPLPEPDADGDGTVTVVGTAHVSSDSVEEVRETIDRERPDVVAVELDEGRYRQLKGETPDDLDSRDLLRGNTVFQFIAYWMLSYVQTRLGERFDIEPGADMKAGIDAAEEHGLGLALVDREIQTTMQRFWTRLSAGEKLRMIGGLALGVTDVVTAGVSLGIAFGAMFGLLAGMAIAPLVGLGTIATLGLTGTTSLAFVGGAVGGAVAGLAPLLPGVRASGAGTLHLLLAGWVGLTIMGAMTQFVPVWSGRTLHSRRLAVASLWLVGAGVPGLFASFVAGAYAWLPVAGTALLAGFWTFAYNIGRTLPQPSVFDVTEAHFAFALASLVAATALGWLLAADLAVRFLGPLPLEAPDVVLAHLTLTVFGFVLVTIVGALYQLAPMFTQSETGPLDGHLTAVERVALPGGIAVLAVGRLFGLRPVAAAGGLAMLVGTAAFAVFFARRLRLARVEAGPMLRRYWLVAGSLFGWTALTLPRWAADPLDFFARFGSPAATHLLFVGVVTFTVVGTVYHVVPFIVWHRRYSDRLGYEPVPMVEDLYDARLAAVEFPLLTGGLALLWLGDLPVVPTWVLVVGGNLLGVGVLLFAANMTLVVWRHRPETAREVLGTLAGRVDD
ncbi:MAG: TraB/GumN family protein [Halobacteriales archaeon]